MFKHRPLVAYEKLARVKGTNFTFVSDNLENLLGYAATIFLEAQFDWLALVHPDDRGAIAMALDHLKVGELTSLRYRVRHKSGEYCWLRDDIRVIQREQETVILGSWLDISEQESLRQALQQAQTDLAASKAVTQVCGEAIATSTGTKNANALDSPPISKPELLQSLERFQKLSGNIPGMIYQFVRRVDGRFELRYTNDYVEDIFGVTRDAAIADIQTIFSLTYPASDLPAILDVVNQSAETLSKWTQEWRIRLPSGQIKWLKGISEPRQYPNGEVIWDGIILDESERKQAEQELVHSRRLQSIVIHTLQNLLKSLNLDFDKILAYLGHAFGSDYSCLICHSLPKEGARIVNEWCHDASKPSLAPVFENLDITPKSWWMQRVMGNQDILINDPSLLPNEALELEHRMDFAGLKRLLAIPILQDNQAPWAVLCLAQGTENAPLFNEQEAHALRLIGEMFYVSAERQAQQVQLQTSATKFREIFEQAGVGIAKLDLALCFTEVNQTLAKMIGAAPADFVGESYWSITPTTEIVGDRQMFVEVQETGFVQHETRIYQNLGREIWVKLTLSQVQPAPPEEPYYIIIFEDISQRKRSEEMNAALVLRDQLLITALGEVTYDHYLPQDILNWKGDYERILGYSPEEIGMDAESSWFGRVHPEDLDAVKAEFERAAQGDRLFELEYRFRHRDGHYLWMHDRGILHGDYHGSPERFIGVLRDISKRKAAEQQQQQQDRLYQQIVETAQEGIWVINAGAKTDYVNPQMAKMLGYEADEMYGKSLFDFIAPEHVEDAQHSFQCRQQGIAEEHDFCFRSRNGEEVWAMVATNALLNDKGEFIGALGMITDVTERRAAEQEILRSQSLLEAIFEESADALFLVDMDTLRTFDCNKKAVAMFERDAKSELIDIEGHILQAQQFTAEELAAIAVEINQTGAWSREVQYVTKSGRVFWGNLAVKRVTVGDRRVNLVRVTDIDDRKRAEQELRRTNEELEQATQLKDEFLANMSHELRTPLNAILGLTEVLGDGTYGQMNERQQHSLNTIERNGQHLLELINDVLNLAKIEAGQMVFHPVAVDLKQICQSSVALIRHQANKKNIDIHLHLPEGSPVVQADQLRLRQALLNLLGNAIKFTPTDGAIRLRLELNGAENVVSIHVRDNGIGIAEDKLDQLFQPFVQLDSSLTRRFAGTGLGLALVKQIAELHSGSVSVSSRLGMGSEFSLHLPWSPPPQTCQPVTEQPPLTPSKPTAIQQAVTTNGDRPFVLIADDDDDNIETIWDYLEGRGYRLIRAVNGREAVALNASEQPDLILMDIQMPELNGLDAMRLIREKFSAEKLPIIALTALAMETDHQRCLEAGANLYLAKPFRLKALIEHMQNLFAQRT
ncbi:hypothetical protein NIES208_14085 [[Limnothrix rosea] IAM M-220]|nr:hypothetical protein NIES208_14085 [[Limnothrix rosea] IAM M-220]